MLGKRGREGDGSGEGSSEKNEETSSSKRMKVEEESGSKVEEKKDSVTGSLAPGQIPSSNSIT